MASALLLTVAAAVPQGGPTDPATSLPEHAAPWDSGARSISSSRAQQFRFQLSPGPWILEIHQLGVDLRAQFLGVDLDSPTGRFGPELYLFENRRDRLVDLTLSTVEAGAAGELRIRLRRPSGEEEASLAARRSLGDGDWAYARGMADGGISAFREAAEAAREAGNEWLLARARLGEGTASRDLQEERENAVEALEEAAELWRHLGEGHLLATTLNQLGLAQAGSGDFEAAEALYGEAAEVSRSLGDGPGEAFAHSNWAVGLLALGRHREAAEHLEAALAAAGEQLSDERRANLANSLGGSHLQAGDLRAAAKAFEQASALFLRAGDETTAAVARMNLGAVHRFLGDYRQALAEFLEAEAMLGPEAGQDHLGSLLNNVGNLYLALGAPERAVHYLERALTLRRESGDRLGEAATLNNLGIAFSRQGDCPGALLHLEQAIELRQALEDERGLAVSREVAAGCHLALGDLERATERARQALEFQRRAGKPLRQAYCSLLLARIEARRTDAPSPRVEEAFRMAFAAAEAVPSVEAEAATLTAWGKLRFDQGELEGAEELLREAVRRIESLRGRAPSFELQATHFARREEAYRRLVQVLLARHRRDPAGGFAEAALAVSEQLRSRVLLDLLREAQVELRQGVPAELADRRRSLQQRLQQSAAAKARAKTEADRWNREEEIQGLLAAIEVAEGQIRRQVPERAGLSEGSYRDAAALQALLDPGTLLLEIFLGEEKSALFVVSEEGVRVIDLPAREVLEELAIAVYQSWSVLTVGRDAAAAAAEHELAEILLSPLGALDGVERIVVVSEGALSYLPFAGLPFPGTEQRILDRWEVVHLPSASVLAALRQRRSSRDSSSLVIFADPVFQASDPRIASGEASEEEAQNQGEATFAAELASLGRLAFTSQEAEAIARLGAATGHRVVTFLGPEANREQALSVAMEKGRFVHFATHGRIDGTSPWLSGLLLSQVDAEGRPRDGFLGLSDLFNLDLQAELVVLSGCRTALGRQVRGEGLLGLTHGVFASGAERLVASLWQVQDRATAKLMEELYRGMLEDGRTPAAALRQAQQEVRRTRRWRNPHYWAAFVLLGDWR